MLTERGYPVLPLWGQFLDHAERVQGPLAATFQVRVGRATTIAHLAACFPQRVDAVACAIGYCHRCYRVPRGEQDADRRATALIALPSPRRHLLPSLM